MDNMMEILENDEITLDDEFRNLEEWDSLSYLSTIAMIDDEHELVIPREDFSNLKTLRDILKYIKKDKEKNK